MVTKAMQSKHISYAASKEKLIEDLRLVVVDAEELLRARELKSPLGEARVRTDLVPR